MVIKKKSELGVLTKSKELCSYVMTITHKSPKEYRFSYVSRLQNLALDIVENIIRANEVFLEKENVHSYNLRLGYQRETMTSLKLLAYFAMLSMEQRCILLKQYEQISLKISDCQNMLGAWMMSDKNRIGIQITLKIWVRLYTSVCWWLRSPGNNQNNATNVNNDGDVNNNGNNVNNDNNALRVALLPIPVSKSKQIRQ